MGEYVSDNTIEQLARELNVNWALRREIQGMSREELQRYLVNLYLVGFEDGAAAIQKHLNVIAERKQAKEADVEEVSIGWDEVLGVIADVKGIGPKLLEAIDSKLREVY